MDETGTTRTGVDEVGTTVCSGKGCHAPADWALLWNNPKLHTPDRRKVWLSCEDHRDHLTLFLDARGFLRSVEPFVPGFVPGAAPETRPDSPADGPR